MFEHVAAVPSHATLLSSKSMSTVPDGLLMRDQNRFRNLPLEFVSL